MYAYWDHGLSFRTIEPGMELPGDTLFMEEPTEAQLIAAFPDYLLVKAQRAFINLVGLLSSALRSYMDSVAQEKLYFDSMTCAVRAGYPNSFRPEAIKFANWMDECHVKFLIIMEEVRLGLREPPTPTELINDMPPMEW